MSYNTPPTSPLSLPNGGTGTTVGYENTVAKLRRAMEKAEVNNLLINPVYSGSATLTQASAVDASTTVYQTKANRYTVKRAGFNSGTTTVGSAGVYAFQNLAGTQDFGFCIEHYTDSATVTVVFKRQTSYGFKLAINDAYVSVSSSTTIAWSTVDPTFNYLVIAGLTGTNKIRVEMVVDLTTAANPAFVGTYTTALTSIWPTDYKTFGMVVGDSFTHGTGSTYQVNDYTNILGILLGLDDLWPLGYSGTGYVAALGGNSFTAGTITAGSNVITLSSTTNLAVNQPIMLNGTGDLSSYFPRYTYITNLVTNTSITVYNPALISGSNVTLFAVNTNITPTDYWQPATQGTTQTRLAFDMLRMPYVPDVVFIALGLNDDANASGYDTVIINTFKLVRTLCPNALIVVIGVPSTAANGGNSGTPNYISSFSQNAENHIKSDFTTWNDPNSIFIADSTSLNGGPGGSRQWGTGYQGATNGTGNNDIYCYTDGTHPSNAGHSYRANWIAEAYRAALKVLP